MKRIDINLEKDLLNRYGPVIGGDALYCALGFKTYGMFRIAKQRGEIPIRVFKIPNRRNWHALTAELAIFLDDLANTSDQSSQMEDIKM